MAVLTLNFESQYLGNGHNVTVILPDKPRDVDAKAYYESGKKYKVLWLLHGTFDDGSGWLRRSMIEVYAREKNLIVVMPSALNSNYVNWDGFATGFKMGDYLTEELMPVIHNWFPASNKPEDNFIAGLSMGGGGTLKYVLAHPECFGGAAVLSSCPTAVEDMDFEGGNAVPGVPTMANRFLNGVVNAGGKEAFLASVENTWDRFFEMQAAGKLPKIMFACGEKDFLYNRYQKFKNACLEKGVDVTFFELPNLAHEWRFWDKAIQKAIEFFDITEQGFTAF